MTELVSFKALWDGHPANQGELEPCKNKDGEGAFGNQCAIRMGVALKAAGVTLPRGSLAHCWIAGHKSEPHVLRAEELAGWILRQRARFGQVEKKVGQKWDKTDGITVEHYRGRQGIVFFKDFWTRAGESDRNPTGDHIDVWNGTYQGNGDDSYFERSKQIWFWELP